MILSILFESNLLLTSGVLSFTLHEWVRRNAPWIKPCAGRVSRCVRRPQHHACCFRALYLTPIWRRTTSTHRALPGSIPLPTSHLRLSRSTQSNTTPCWPSPSHSEDTPILDCYGCLFVHTCSCISSSCRCPRFCWSTHRRALPQLCLW